MLNHVRANLALVGLTGVVCCVLYPLALLAVGQGLVPTRASGSLLVGPEGKTVGSRLIAQEFKGAEWFTPRPSAADFNAAASGGSNLSASNPKLRQRVEETLKSRGADRPVPADAVTASGSGLDPHITLSNAKGQLDRVVSAWVARTERDPAEVRKVVEEILAGAASRPFAGLFGGEDLVNVLEINLELDRRLNLGLRKGNPTGSVGP